jgi:hypothetical protein
MRALTATAPFWVPVFGLLTDLIERWWGSAATATCTWHFSWALPAGMYVGFWGPYCLERLVVLAGCSRRARSWPVFGSQAVAGMALFGA